jgi:hypothetical protein
VGARSAEQPRAAEPGAGSDWAPDELALGETTGPRAAGHCALVAQPGGSVGGEPARADWSVDSGGCLKVAPMAHDLLQDDYWAAGDSVRPQVDDLFPADWPDDSSRDDCSAVLTGDDRSSPAAVAGGSVPPGDLARPQADDLFPADWPDDSSRDDCSAALTADDRSSPAAVAASARPGDCLAVAASGDSVVRDWPRPDARWELADCPGGSPAGW